GGAPALGCHGASPPRTCRCRPARPGGRERGGTCIWVHLTTPLCYSHLGTACTQPRAGESHLGCKRPGRGVVGVVVVHGGQVAQGRAGGRRGIGVVGTAARSAVPAARVGARAGVRLDDGSLGPALGDPPPSALAVTLGVASLDRCQ